MDANEAALFLMAMSALSESEDGGGASHGLIESAEPTTATCTVERSE